MLEKDHVPGNTGLKDIMSSQPKTIDPDELAVNALDIMRRHEISQIVVAREGNILEWCIFTTF